MGKANVTIEVPRHKIKYTCWSPKSSLEDGAEHLPMCTFLVIIFPLASTNWKKCNSSRDFYWDMKWYLHHFVPLNKQNVLSGERRALKVEEYSYIGKFSRGSELTFDVVFSDQVTTADDKRMTLTPKCANLTPEKIIIIPFGKEQWQCLARKWGAFTHAGWWQIDSTSLGGRPECRNDPPR